MDNTRSNEVEANTRTVYRVKRVITMNPAQPTADAVAVQNGRIVAVGNFDHVVGVVGVVGAVAEGADVANGEYLLDEQFADSVLIAGLIDQHLHPVLGASTFQRR